MDTKNPLLSYVLFAIAVIFYLIGALGYLSMDLVIGLMSIFGFSGLAALRAYIVSKGWKTYTIVVIVVIGAVLKIAGVIGEEMFYSILTAGLPLAGITIQQAEKKVNS